MPPELPKPQKAITAKRVTSAQAKRQTKSQLATQPLPSEYATRNAAQSHPVLRAPLKATRHKRSSKENTQTGPTFKRMRKTAPKSVPAVAILDSIEENKNGRENKHPACLYNSGAKYKRQSEDTSNYDDPPAPIHTQPSDIGHLFSMGPETEARERQFKDEARKYVNEQLWLDFEGLNGLAAPADGELRKRADAIATRIALEFENLLTSEASSNADEKLFNWIRAGATVGLENDMHGQFDSFMRFVAERVRQSYRRWEPGHLNPKRTIEAFCKNDVAIDGSEQTYRLDIFVECLPIDPSSEFEVNSESLKPVFGKMFTIVEAKKTNCSAEFKNACIHLILYIREAYIWQLNRRFAWGMTLCGDAVRVCNFGNDHILASREMKLTEKSGRAKLIKYLVYWSFCEEHRLGYDPTMTWLPELKCWKIDVPTLPKLDSEQELQTSKQFYTQSTVADAEHLFGRHTRSFLATDTEPKCIVDTAAQNCKYVLKDSWVEAPIGLCDDVRDEIGHLNKIREKLKEFEDVKGSYPTIVAGGQVQFDRSDGKGIVEDTTETILGELFHGISAQRESSDHSKDIKKGPRLVPLRVHKRIVTTPIGKPLHNLDCPFKLIKVVTDAMRAHSRIRWDADILHRDISSNNILFYETGDDEMVRGLLIDFDHAVDLSATKSKHHLDPSGTHPFVSINNLAKQVDLVTGLDDWESALYVLCWVFTYGFNADLVPDPEILNKLHIRKWCEDSLNDIKHTKQGDLHTSGIFRLLTNQFLHKLPKVELLQKLVDDLRTTLFDNPGLTSEFHGTVDKIVEIEDDEIEINPFENRMSKERELMDSLLQVLENFVEETRGFRLSKQ